MSMSASCGVSRPVSLVHLHSRSSSKPASSDDRPVTLNFTTPSLTRRVTIVSLISRDIIRFAFEGIVAVGAFAGNPEDER